MRLLIAIPVYNELKYVEHVIQKVRQYHDEILLIDDGSTDGTGDLLDSIKATEGVQVIRHAKNSGYGQSLIDAFTYADRNGYDWVITMDCDEQHEPEMIPEFKRHIETDEWDIISGSRYLNPHGSDDLPPQDRRTINVTITNLLNALLGYTLTDSFCGFKAHRVSAMRKLDLTETGYAFPLQFWPQIYREELRLKEIPVRLIYNDPNRYFGGDLDDARNRLKHYLNVLNVELQKPTSPAAKPQAAKHRGAVAVMEGQGPHTSPDFVPAARSALPGARRKPCSCSSNH